MSNMLNKVPKELKSLIKDLREQALKADVRAYIVGGFVRDLILGVNNLDLDIVVEGDGIKFAQSFVKRYGGEIAAHKRFGTATVKLKSGVKIDFSSARKEAYPKPAHLPVVYPGPLKDDLFRRDFTINAMAVSLNNGKAVDFFGGRKDLKQRKIRILHSLSFNDDPTRILRGIRFEQRYNFVIEPETLKLLKDAVRLKLLERVHPHRIRDDLILILKEKNPLKEIKRIEELAGFKFIHRSLKFSAGNYAYLQALEKEIKWFNKSFPKRRNLDTWLIYFIGLVDSLNEADIRDICQRLGLRKGDEKRVLIYKNTSRAFVAELSSRKIKPSGIFALLEPLSYETVIALRAKRKNPVFRRHIADFLEIYNGMCLLVSGKDLHGLGLPPGPKYKKIFSYVLNSKLNGEVINKDEELSLIRNLLRDRRLN